MAQKKQGFVYGALILMLSNIIVKVVGALFKIPLANVIGDTAMGYFSSAYSIYSMCFLIATAGLPVAISRMIAAAKAKENHKDVDRIYRVSLLIFVVIGLLGSAFLFFGSGMIADFSEEPELSVCIKAISPIMFFICVVSCIRGYFQGHQNMSPTAVSQVIEVMGNLFLGLSAGILANRAGKDPAAVASYALFGVTLGVVLSALYMSFAKWVSDRDHEVQMENRDVLQSRKSIVKQLLFIAIPITLSSSVLSLTSVIDSVIAVKRMNEACVGITHFLIRSDIPVALTLYGSYMAKAVPLFNLPPQIIYPFAISIIPAISSAQATGNNQMLTKTMNFTFRIVSVVCLPCAFGLGVLSGPIINLLFSSNEAIFQNAAGQSFFSNAIASPMLSILACAILFSGLISVSGAVLQATGFAHLSIISTCCGVAAKAISVWVLIGIPGIGHYGIPISTLICYLIMFAFNMFFLRKHAHYRFHFRKILLRPLIASLFCGITALGCYVFLERFVLSASLATVAAIGLAALVYGIALFRLRGFEKEDVRMLPKGEVIEKVLVRLHLLEA